MEPAKTVRPRPTTAPSDPITSDRNTADQSCMAPSAIRPKKRTAAGTSSARVGHAKEGASSLRGGGASGRPEAAGRNAASAAPLTRTRWSGIGAPAQTIAPPTSPPVAIPMEKKAWQVERIGRPRRSSIAKPATFIAMSIAAVPKPTRARITARPAAVGASAIMAIARSIAAMHPRFSAAGDTRVESHPAAGSATSAPAGTPRSTSPSAPSPRANRSLSSGMRGSQDPKISAWSPNTARIDASARSRPRRAATAVT